MSQALKRVTLEADSRCAVLSCLLVLVFLVPTSLGQNSAGYTWSNVYTGGGGGYIPNIIFNPSQQNLIYARTDIGGAYRWNPATNLWVPLMDWVTWDNWNMLGVESLATDPVNPDNLYIMAGLYTNSFTTQNGTLLISNNQGSTFTQVAMPFKVGGNMPARNMGERLAVDPNLNSILYFGARSGNGLWKSTNSGATWGQVTNFPNPGTYVILPGDIYEGDIVGIAWVVFDPRTGSSGKATQTIYVGVANPDGPNIYVTTNGGTSWSALPGQLNCTLTGTQTSGSVSCTDGAAWTIGTGTGQHPGPGFFPDRAVLGPNGILYVTYSDGAGPYDGTIGDVQAYNTATGVWTDVAPVLPTAASDADYFGYCGLAVDKQVPTTIMVSAFNSWWPDTILWRSTNSGATWSQIWNWTSYPSRSFFYTLNDSAAPWVNEGDTNPVPPIEAPELGWMVSGLAIDPFNSNHMLYGTGMTMWGTENLTAWDSGNQFALSVQATGIEETAVLDLVSPPSGGGAHLYSALGDIGGFIHTSLTTAPTFPWSIPFFGTRTSIDYAELSPSFMAMVGNGSPTANPPITSSAFTFSSGTSATAWFAGSVDPPGYSTNGGGTIAAAADASRVVWNPTGMGAFYSTTTGSSWTASTGLPAGGKIISDRVNPLQFYDYAAGQFYVSTNGGVSFTATPATGLPASGDPISMHAVPGIAADVWLAGGSVANNVYGLWHSTNAGASFTKLANVTQADVIGFGKAAPGTTYPTLFTNAEIGGVRGIFVSTNEGATWTQINDPQHEYAMAASVITGDPQVFGTVYLGTNGRGIIMGTGTPTSTPSFTLSASPSSLAITQGGNGTSSVTVTPTGGFSSSVALTASPLPSGVTANFNPASLTSGSSTLTLTASSTAATGTTTVVVTGTGGGITQTATIGLTVQAGACTTVPSAPPGLTATAVSSSGINLSWTAVTPPTNCTIGSYSVFRSTTSGFTPSSSNQVGTVTSGTTFSNTGLTASTTYYFKVEAVDAAGSSAASAQASATTLAASSCTTIPSAPTGLTATVVSSSGINLSWTAVTPPTNCTISSYSVFRSTTSGFTPSSSNQVGTVTGGTTFSDTGLAPSTTYYYKVEAVDAAGSSAASAQASATTLASSGGFACHIAYSITNQWSGGFQAAITINNTGTTGITNWTLTWAFANGQTITQIWNASETQSGANVTVNNLSYNGSIPAGGSYNGMGFNGSWNNTANSAPASFAVNGTTCK